MKNFLIVNADDVPVGSLVLGDNNKFAAELFKGAEDYPYSLFGWKGQRNHVDDADVRKWIAGRVMPPDRQMRELYLKARGMDHYDAIELFFRLNGTSANDSFKLKEIL